MLKPASMYEEDILYEFKSRQYTKDMLYASGYMDAWLPNILEVPDGNTYQYAITDYKDKLKGYIAFTVDWYSKCARDFGILSFDKSSLWTARGLEEIMDILINDWHIYRIEWKMISGNPAQKAYDRFIKRYKGSKLILKDTIRDQQGVYHDDYIYEILIKENKPV